MYATKRPSKKAIQNMINWFHDNNICLYTGNANLDTGQRDFGQMDITTAQEAIEVYEHNKAGDWIDPKY